MSRASRIPYHQNVHDLLQIEPGKSPEAARMIAEHEAAHGPLPASVREWYLVPNVVSLFPAGHPDWAALYKTVWFVFSNQDQVLSLSEVLGAIAKPLDNDRGRFAWVLIENQGVLRWYLRLDGSDDPSVWCDNDVEDDPREWTEVAPTFSAFTSAWIGEYYVHSPTHIHKEGWPARTPDADEFEKRYRNGLWLRTPAEPFVPAVIDYLTELLGEPKRTPRPGNVTTYTFRPDGGTIRVTADEPGLGGALSAWWVHADTPDRLADLARLVLPFGTLRETLRADTDPAREVLRQLAGERS